jgi:hypothetical protein
VGRWDLCQKVATQILHSLWNAPDPEPASTGKAGKKSFAVVLSLGLSCAEFQGLTAVQWNDARLCGLLKEIPTALIALFHDAKLIQQI